MKKFNYQPKHFALQITTVGIFTGVICVFSLYQILLGSYKELFAFVLILAGYNTWNTFVSISNPKEIQFDENQLVLSAYGKNHIFKLEDIKQIQMRYVSGNRRLYVTLNGGSLKKGRYWVRLCEFEQQEEIEDFFAELEYKIDPDSLIVRARREGRERLKKARLVKGEKCV